MSSINRRAHCLRREKTLAMPRKVILYDTETEATQLPDGSIRQKLKLGWVCSYQRAYGRHIAKAEWQYFTTPLEFWQFVYKHTERKQKLWVISHNLSFDFTIVEGWKYLGQGGFKLKFFHNNGCTCVISVRSKAGSILLMDSMNWFAESLEAIGNRLGIPKVNVDFETCTVEQLSLHCKRDVEILLGAYKDFCRFLDGNKISRLCYTIGSTAMAAYLLNYYDHKIWIHNNAEAIDLERESYRGGRTECFHIGELNNGPYYILDVNSLYPAVMAEFSYPTKYRKIYNSLSGSNLLEMVSKYSVIAKVLIETQEAAYAVKRDRTIFPVGRFWVTLTTPELFYALQHNHIVKIDRAVVYEQAPIFTRYVKRIYGLRQDFKSAGVKSYEQICKLLLNSLYGKFGQKAEVWEKIGECPGQQDRTETVFYPESNRRGQVRYLLGEIWELTGYEECFNSFPAICAHVTAYARLYLWDLMKVCGSDNYFYCDTDSLVVNEKGLKNLSPFLHDTDLGALKVEEITPTITIRGLKDYVTQSKDVIKGIRKSAVKIADGVYEQERWPSLRGLLSTNSANTFTIKTQRRVITRKYTKGTVLNDGSIRPLELADADSPFLWLE